MPPRPVSRRWWRKLPWRGLACWIAALTWWQLRDLASDVVAGRPVLTRPGDEDLRIVSWNLRRLGDPEASHDLGRLRRHFDALAPDLMAVQEIYEPHVLTSTFPEGRVRLSRGGGRGEQRLGFWWNPARVEAIGAPVEFEELSLGGRLRPSFAQRFRPVGLPCMTFWAVTVHLKAGPRGAKTRTEQWRLLVRVLTGLAAPRTPLLLLGDFNTTGDADGDPKAEMAALGARLTPLGLRRLENRTGCSAYWRPSPVHGELDASELDLAWIRGLNGVEYVLCGLQCRAHNCQSFRSSPAFPDLDQSAVSDHCPLVLDLPLTACERRDTTERGSRVRN